MNPEPFRIDPTFSPRIWGSRSLAPLYPEKSNLAEPIGEAWLTDVNCRVATGSFTGISLADAWREMPAEWRGSMFSEPREFPLLVKFIFPPTNYPYRFIPTMRTLPSTKGRWEPRQNGDVHVVSANQGASLLLGLKPGVTKKSFLAALENRTVEDLFQRHSVNAGDTFLVPARTPHTIGANMVICEVQEYSDLTYRVYDYDRRDPSGKPRELHIEKALAVMDFSGKQIEKVPRVALPTQRGARALLAACPYFARNAPNTRDSATAPQTKRVSNSWWCSTAPDKFAGPAAKRTMLPASAGSFPPISTSSSSSPYTNPPSSAPTSPNSLSSKTNSPKPASKTPKGD